MLMAILGMLVVFAAILGNLDGLANILDKMPFFQWFNIKRGFVG